MTPEKPNWVTRVENLKTAHYVGLYDLPDREGPFYVFWQAEIPAEFRGDARYDNYFGLIWRASLDEMEEFMRSGSEPKGTLYITSARSIRKAVFSAFEYEPGQYIVSRYRHDFVKAPNGEFLDGGLAYVRGSVLPSHRMRIADGVEIFEPNVETPQ